MKRPLQAAPLRWMVSGAILTAVAIGGAAAQAPSGGPPPPGVAGADPLTIARAVRPEIVTVGDPFVSVVRVAAPPGSSIEFHGLPVRDSIQALDTVRVVGATADAGATAAYRLVAWVAGAELSAAPLVRVRYPDGELRSYRVPLAMPRVRSVLPAEGDVEPRPSRGVLPLPRRGGWWPWALAAGALVLVLALVAWLRRRGGAVVTPGLPDPRADALSALRSLESETRPGHVYVGATRVLRTYLARSRPALGEEWTTTELLHRAGGGALQGEAAIEALRDLLVEADRVKFSGERPRTRASAEFLERITEWIRRYPTADPAGAEGSRPPPREAA